MVRFRSEMYHIWFNVPRASGDVLVLVVGGYSVITCLLVDADSLCSAV